MFETIVFPDAVALVCDHLRTRLSPTPVVARVPATRPAAFVRVKRVGGVRRNLVTDEPTLTVEVWAATEEDACDISSLARAYVCAMLGVGVCRVTEFSGPALLPDPLSDQPRYSFTVSVAIVGAAV